MKPKNILALDTSTDTGLVVLKKEGKVFSRVQQEPREHNRFLLSMIQDVLNDAGVELKDVDAFVCGIGPGSFVGVRLGVSVIQGLAYATQKPVYALSSLMLQAQAFFRMNKDEKEVIIAHDARMQAFYFGHYRNVEGLAQRIGQEQLVRIADEFNCDVQDNIMITGNAGAALASKLNSRNCEGIPNLQTEDLVLQARECIKTTKALLPYELQPAYFNDEANWQKTSI